MAKEYKHEIKDLDSGEIPYTVISEKQNPEILVGWPINREIITTDITADKKIKADKIKMKEKLALDFTNLEMIEALIAAIEGNTSSMNLLKAKIATAKSEL